MKKLKEGEALLFSFLDTVFFFEVIITLFSGKNNKIYRSFSFFFSRFMLD